MKTIALSKWAAICLSSLAVNATAGQACVTGKPDKSYTGTVDSIDANNHLLRVDGIFLHKDFNLGKDCGYILLDTGPGKISGLHAGQKVVVAYHNTKGTRVADRVEQEPMAFVGKVASIDPKNRTMIVRHHGLEKTFQVAESCPVGLYDNQTGTLVNVHPGNRVTVTYETPYDMTVARRISENGQVFTGELTAINLNDRTAAAKDILAHKKFNIAPNCEIVIDGKPGAHLADIKVGETLEFDYTDVNGINTVNQISSVPESSSRMTASTESPNNPSLLNPRF